MAGVQHRELAGARRRAERLLEPAPSALRSRSPVPSIGGNTDRTKESTGRSGCGGFRPVTNSA